MAHECVLICMKYLGQIQHLANKLICLKINSAAQCREDIILWQITQKTTTNNYILKALTEDSTDGAETAHWI